MLEEVYVNLHQYSIMPFHIYQIGKDFLTVSDETFIVDTKTNVLTLTESGRKHISHNNLANRFNRQDIF